jgi:DNA ligase-1
MALIEAGGESLLYTGDFKLRPGLSAEPCQPRPADTLLMETTYGRPEYRFPPSAEVMRGIVRFCKEALDNDETAVLLGYSLGKSQELLCGLAEAELPIVLHGAVHRLSEIYQEFGHCFPKYERYEASNAKGKVLLCPPSVTNSVMLRNLGRARVAVLTGWAVDPNYRFRYQADAAFPLSDHADFPDLIEMVKRVAPKKVYTLHGFAAEFAQTLRQIGFDAQAISEPEQMILVLRESAVREENASAEPEKRPGADVPPSDGPSSDVDRADAFPSTLFATFAETCAAIAATSSKLEKVRLLSDYLRTLEGATLSCACTWFTGVPFPPSENKVLQLGWAVLRDAFSAVGGLNQAEFLQVYLKHSDLGETAFEIWQRGPGPPPRFSMQEVDSLFHRLQAARGPSGKLPLLKSALQQCSALEAKFLVKIITSDLRIGLKEGLVEEAVARAWEAPAQEVRQANLLLGNIGETAELARKGELAGASVVPFRPIKFMLASPEETAANVWERMRSVKVPRRSASEAPLSAKGPESPAPIPPLAEQDLPAPLWVEDKYDGVRCQLHKVGPRVALYSRDLKEITTTFHELADSARSLAVDVILDGEILAMRDEQVLPFAELQRRLGRREHDLFLGAEVPIKFLAFDLLWMNSVSYFSRPLQERRQALEGLAPLPALLRLAHVTQARSIEEIETAFKAARQLNNEGLMIKDSQSLYCPGRRGLAWLKLKKALATLDCVVVGAEYGHGKRNKVLSDYTFAVRDEQTGELKTIGKAYRGLTDAEIAHLTGHFLSKTIRQQGRYHQVEPDTVLEIAFDQIQPSDRHASGLAMRFPRILRIRTEKTPAEIDTLATARQLVKRPSAKGIV